MDYINNLINSLSNHLGSVLPGVVGAILVLLIGYFIARILKRLTKKLLSKTSIDERIGQTVKTKVRMDDFISRLVYYLVLIYTFLVALNLLGVEGVLSPIQNMVQDFLTFLPNVVAAGIIGYAGYMIATIASEASGFIAARLEELGQKNGVDTTSVNVGSIVKQIVFIFVFIPILIISLDTLQMTAISEPATDMLRIFMLAIPKILSAALILLVFYIVGKYLVGILVNLLNNMGLNKFSNEIGLNQILGDRNLTSVLGNTTLFFIIFAGIIAAIEKANLPQVVEILENLFHISGQIFFGLIILVIGMYVSTLAVKAISKTEQSRFVVQLVRFVTLGLFLAFALHTMGVAEKLVEMAFGLTIGAFALACALAFGLGGRESAGKYVDKMLNR
jgi:hypothetical protein